MTKLGRTYLPHLVIREMSLLPEGEWSPRLPGWSLIQVASGTGYCLHPRVNQKLETGTVLVMAAQARGSIRASQLGGLSLSFFHVEPERLTGLVSLNEQRFFETAASKELSSPQIFPALSPVAIKMRTLCAGPARTGASFRLQLLQLFTEVFGNELEKAGSGQGAALDARERLLEFLKQTPESELLHLRFAELVSMTHCTPRHLSRIFSDVVGMSFRDRQTELRLNRACELLATTESKVVDVALESGYQSLSLFNLLFTRRFGVSPGKWRQKIQNPSAITSRPRRRAVCLVS
jgi:AraC-like DNA-binding protein